MHHHRPDEPPRIRLDVADDTRRMALAEALRDTGYEVVERTDDGPEDEDFDLVVADGVPSPGSIPTLLLPDPFDVVEIELLVLDLLGWDGPPTLRRVPVAATT
jgi:hypothetical protein